MNPMKIKPHLAWEGGLDLELDEAGRPSKAFHTGDIPELLQNATFPSFRAKSRNPHGSCDFAQDDERGKISILKYLGYKPISLAGRVKFTR